MKRLEIRFKAGVKVLTLAMMLLGSGCSFLHEYSTESCNSHAYVRAPIDDFLSTRFRSGSQPRMAVIPFTTAANLSGHEPQRPAFGEELAWKVHARLLDSGDFPIVEVMNRRDWPGKKDEFFTGNFGSLSMARAAGYDLVLIGYLDGIQTLTTLSAFTKVIDVESGVTLWYGKSSASTAQPAMQRLGSHLWLREERPDQLYLPDLTESLASCIVRDITDKDAEPS